MATEPSKRHPSPPPPGPPPGGPPAGDPGDDDDETPQELRQDARDTLSAADGAWTDFRTAAGEALGDHVDNTFGYFESILGDDSTPTDWIKDGVALWINCFTTGR